MRRLLALATLLALAACPSPQEIVPAPPPPPPPMPKVPPGCELSLAGAYRHQDDPSFRYDVTDDGSAVHVRAYRQFGATRKPIASSAADIDLRRTATGLRGAAQVTAQTLSGSHTCTVQFPYEVTACTGTSITLRTVHEVRLTESCEPEDPLHPDSVSNVLIRLEPPDGGAEPDAGAPILDAGAAVDAGARIDTLSQSVDAGRISPDEGLINGTERKRQDSAGPGVLIADAGETLDAGSVPDAGTTSVDAGVVTQSVAADAGSQSRP